MKREETAPATCGVGVNRVATAAMQGAHTRQHTSMPVPAAHLCVAPSGLLYQAPGHGAAHREALEEASDEVTEAEGHQLLWGSMDTGTSCHPTMPRQVGHPLYPPPAKRLGCYSRIRLSLSLSPRPA